MMNEQDTEIKQDEVSFSESTIFDAPKTIEIKQKKPSRNKKTWLLILLIVIIAAVLVGGIFLIQRFLPEKPGEQSEDSIESSLPQYDSLINKAAKGLNGIQSFTWDYEGKSYSIKKNESKTWEIDEFGDVPYNSDGITSLLQDFVTVYPCSILSEDGTAEEISLCELGTPSAHVKVSYTDGDTFEANFGCLSHANQSDYYMQVVGDPAIYCVESYLYQDATTDPTTLLAMRLVEAPSPASDDTTGVAKVTAMTLSGFLRSKPVSMRYTTADDPSSLKMACNLLITKPYLRASDTDATASWDTDLVSLNAEGVTAVHPTAEELKKYGLDTPHSVCELTVSIRKTTDEDGNDLETPKVYNTVKHTIRLGSLRDDKDYYCMVDDIDVIYEVYAEDVPWAELAYDDLVNDNLFLRYITDIASISLTANGKTSVLSLKHGSSFDGETSTATLDATLDGKTMDTDNVRALYRKLMMVQRIAGVPENAVESGTPTLQITLKPVNKNDTNNTDFSFYPYSANRYLCKGSDGELYLVKASDIEELQNDISKFLDGKNLS